jgi:methylenetetrahydrofolate reductase (NADPH)
MRIDQMIKEREEPLFSFEFFPPKSEDGERNLNAALDSLRELDPAFVSVTYGAGGSTRDKTLEVVDRIRRDYGLEAMAHFTCVAATVDELRATLDSLTELGVENVLALRGDPPDGGDWTATEGGLSYSSELVELIASEYPHFAIGAACFPETHIAATSPEDDLRNLKEKVDKGVDMLVTQLFFDNSLYFDFVERARAIGIETPIVPGVMPITNVAQITRIAQLCGSDLPAALQAELEARADNPEAVQEFGVAYATLQCSDLLAGGAPGIHFYTLNRSPATRAILSALRLHRPWA